MAFCSLFLRLIQCGWVDRIRPLLPRREPHQHTSLPSPVPGGRGVRVSHGARGLPGFQAQLVRGRPDLRGEAGLRQRGHLQQSVSRCDGWSSECWHLLHWGRVCSNCWSAVLQCHILWGTLEFGWKWCFGSVEEFQGNFQQITFHKWILRNVKT